MLVFLLALACSHTQAVWEHTPPSLTAAPTTEVSVVTSDRRCQTVADALAVELTMREGVRVIPGARTRLLLNMCQVKLRTEVDIEQNYPALAMDGSGVMDVREQVVRAEGSVILTVELDGSPIDMLESEGRRVRLIREGEPTYLHRRSVVRNGLIRDLSEDLAQQLVPVPEVVRRRWYRNPEPGTARALHNQAVDAERAGDLGEAIRLAQQAMNASRTLRSVDYLDMLQQRRDAVQYVEQGSNTP